MQVNITNQDGSMYVHEIRGAVFVTWVSKEHLYKAAGFPADNADVWVKLISDMTGIQCNAERPCVHIKTIEPPGKSVEPVIHMRAH